jgi:NAD(P)-dependent dehydrogenase (short-subunit alcohol dehydrogenase family)
MQDKVALVTGAGAGIGRAIALRLANEGASVVVADVDEEGGSETVRRIEADAGRGAFVLADVSVEADAREMVDFAETTFGGLDVLVNNAGGAPEPHFPEAAPEHWLRTLDLNLRGVMLSIHFAVRAMRRRGGGVIVNISSMAGVGYHPHDAPEYAAAKAGVARLTATLAPLRETMGVRVNCICPGWVETEAVHEALARMTEEDRRAESMPPPAVLIQPEEIADAVAMFVRDDTLAGRVMIWPDDEPQRLVPVDASH